MEMQSGDSTARITGAKGAFKSCDECFKFYFDDHTVNSRKSRPLLFKDYVYFPRRLSIPRWLGNHYWSKIPEWNQEKLHLTIQINQLKFGRSSGLDLGATWIKHYYCRPDLVFYAVTISVGLLQCFEKRIGRATDWAYVLPFQCLCDSNVNYSTDPTVGYHIHLIVATFNSHYFERVFFKHMDTMSDDVLLVSSNRTWAKPLNATLKAHRIESVVEFTLNICSLCIDRPAEGNNFGTYALDPSRFCYYDFTSHFSMAHYMVPHAFFHLLLLLPGARDMYLKEKHRDGKPVNCEEIAACVPYLRPGTKYILDDRRSNAYMFGLNASGRTPSNTYTYLLPHNATCDSDDENSIPA